ncbi:hypothetical protein EYR40_003244 [Pleurotus pulmonarius]|nr:hypothetical protein EYR40_003244 [Pleurotus pulmonarius]
MNVTVGRSCPTSKATTVIDDHLIDDFRACLVTAQEQASQDTHTQPEQQLRVNQPRARSHTPQAVQPRVEPRSPAAQASKPRDEQLGVNQPRAYAPQAFDPPDEQR